MDNLEVVLEADRRLREKFGSLITDWKPTAENCFFLPETEYDAGFNKEEGHLSGKACVHKATRIIYFRMSPDTTENDLLATATHELLHLHQGEALVPFLFDHKDEFEGWSDDEKFQVRYLNTEVIVNLLVSRTLGKIGRLDTLGTSFGFLSAVTRVGLQRMVDIIGERYDQQLFLLLGGTQTSELVPMFEDVFGEGSFREWFLNLIDCQTRADFVWTEEEEESVTEELAPSYIESLMEEVESAAQKVGRPELGQAALRNDLIEFLALAYRKAKPEDQQWMREVLLARD